MFSAEIIGMDPCIVRNHAFCVPSVQDGGIVSKESAHYEVIVDQNSTVLPQWMKQYFNWHNEQLLLLNETNWRDFKYYISRCLATDSPCGGASDRLHPL